MTYIQSFWSAPKVLKPYVRNATAKKMLDIPTSMCYSVIIMMPKKTRNNCKYCGVEVDRPEKVFCSLKCFNLLKYESTLKKYNNLCSLNIVLTSRVVRKVAFSVYPKKCSICGIEQWNGKEAPLVVDHIDGNPTNNVIENLRIICPNCDAQLPTYKSKNYGNGRANRRKAVLV